MNINFNNINNKELLENFKKLLKKENLKRPSLVFLAFLMSFSSLGAAKYEKEEIPENDISNEEVLEDVKDETNTTSNQKEVIETFNNISNLLSQKIIEYTNSNEYKIAKACKNYNLTRDQFEIICGIVLHEAQAYSYVDAYGVINTLVNRIYCSRWVNQVNRSQGAGKGNNIFNQVIQRGQFSVYANKTYTKYLYADPSVQIGKQAVIDVLSADVYPRVHNCTQFRWNAYGRGIHLSNRGNWYISPIASYEYTSNNFTNVTVADLVKREQELKNKPKTVSYVTNNESTEVHANSIVNDQTESLTEDTLELTLKP